MVKRNNTIGNANFKIKAISVRLIKDIENLKQEKQEKVGKKRTVSFLEITDNIEVKIK